MSGDERAVIAFLESSPLLRERPELIHHGPDGTTLLHLAAARLMPEVASWALAHGADVNRPSGNGFTPIDMLGRWPTGHPHDRLEELSDLLLRHGAEPTAFWAVAMNKGDWLRARHAEGRLANPVSDVGGLVTFAVRLDRPEMLTLLLDLGFDPDERPDPADPLGKPLEYLPPASARRPGGHPAATRRHAAVVNGGRPRQGRLAPCEARGGNARASAARRRSAELRPSSTGASTCCSCFSISASTPRNASASSVATKSTSRAGFRWSGRRRRGTWRWRRCSSTTAQIRTGSARAAARRCRPRIGGRIRRCSIC